MRANGPKATYQVRFRYPRRGTPTSLAGFVNNFLGSTLGEGHYVRLKKGRKSLGSVLAGARCLPWDKDRPDYGAQMCG